VGLQFVFSKATTYKYIDCSVASNAMTVQSVISLRYMCYNNIACNSVYIAHSSYGRCATLNKLAWSMTYVIIAEAPIRRLEKIRNQVTHAVWFYSAIRNIVWQHVTNVQPNTCRTISLASRTCNVSSYNTVRRNTTRTRKS
jgi:hypothetical protein